MNQYTLPPRALIIFGFAIMALFASFYYLLQVWLIIFGSVLFAVFLSGLADYARQLPKIGKKLEKVSQPLLIGIITFLLFTVICTFLANFGTDLVNQFSDIKKMIPTAITTIDEYLQGYPVLYKWLTSRDWFIQIQQNPHAFFSQYSQEAVNTLPMLLSKFMSGVGTFLIILLLGLFLVLNPKLYQQSFIALIPKAHRDKAKYLLERSYEALKQWLVGQMVVMSFVGVSTAVALWFMDVPFALALGVIAFIADFIPVLGPWLAAIPIVLVALIVTPKILLWVIVMIVVVQQIESYVVSPLVQQRLVDLPPVALLLSQIIMGSLTGILGIALATPIMVIVIVWTQVLYIKFILGDDEIKIMGQTDEDFLKDRYRPAE